MNKLILYRLCMRVIGKDEEIPIMTPGIGYRNGDISRPIKTRNNLKAFQRKKLNKVINSIME